MKNQIRDFLNKQQQQLKDLQSKWNEDEPIFEPLLKKLEALKLEDLTLSNDLDLRFTGNAERLTVVIRALRTSGFESKGEGPKKNQPQYSNYYRHPKANTNVWLFFTSSICRCVQIGTKTIEQPIFEIVCGEQDFAAIQSADNLPL